MQVDTIFQKTSQGWQVKAAESKDFQDVAIPGILAPIALQNNTTEEQPMELSLDFFILLHDFERSKTFIDAHPKLYPVCPYAKGKSHFDGKHDRMIPAHTSRLGTRNGTDLECMVCGAEVKHG